MPTKLKRYMVSFPEDILPLIQKDCEINGMKVGTRIMSILTEHYRPAIAQPMIFGQDQPISKESRRARPLVFEAPAQPVAVPASDRRASLDQGKS